MNDKIYTFLSCVLSILLIVLGSRIWGLPLPELTFTVCLLNFAVFPILKNIASFCASLYLEKERTRELKAIALDMKLYSRQKDDEKINRFIKDMKTFQEIELAKKHWYNNFILAFFLELVRIYLLLIGWNTYGKTSEIRNIFEGRREGVSFMICDLHLYARKTKYYSKAEYSTVSETESSKTVIIFISENLQLSNFRITNKSQVRQQFFNEDICTFYEAEQNLCTEAKGNRLICYRANKIVQPQEMKCFLETGFEVLNLFEEYCGSDNHQNRNSE